MAKTSRRPPLRSFESAAHDVDFPPTQWSLVQRAKGGTDSAQSGQALSELTAGYREAIHAFVSAHGYPADETQRLVGEFFETLAEPSALGSIQNGGTRFRIWLLARLRAFLAGKVPPPAPNDTNRSASTARLKGTPGFGLATTLPSKRAPNSVVDVPLPGRCPECGTLIPAGIPNGLCPVCLLASGLERLPPQIGDYEIIELLGQGGESYVYRGRQAGVERDVALKVMKEDQADSPEQAERFRRAAKIAATLQHPNIVDINDLSGLGDDPPFYVMQLVVGGTLAHQHRREQFRDPREAARLMVKIARAVEHAHQHGVLHRDLKPSNILLDVHNEPYVADFLAKRIGGNEPAVSCGTVQYMSFEQASGQGGAVAADVYGLGAIFYELLTGKPPTNAKTLDELRRWYEAGELVPPSESAPRLNRDLDAICRSALDKDPERRPRSAAVFADSLECVLEHRPPLWPRVSARRRAALWAIRHPWLAISAVFGTALLIVADIATLLSVQTEQAELSKATLHSNATLASAQARAVLALFEKDADETARAASDPAVTAILKQGTIVDSAHALEQAFGRARNYDSIGIFAADGRMLARFPTPPQGYLGKTFDFRDYFECARTLGIARTEPSGRLHGKAQVCISRAFRGQVSKHMECAFSAPVYDDNHEWIGMVVLNKHAKPTLGEIEIADIYQSGQVTALFGWRDRDAPGTPRPEQLTAVAHPALFTSDEYALGSELTQQLVAQFGRGAPPGQQLEPARLRPREDANYVDPITHEHMLAGFAPVGGTGYIVAVATPTDKALGATQRHADVLTKYAALLNLGFLLIAGIAVFATLRQSSSSGAHQRRWA